MVTDIDTNILLDLLIPYAPDAQASKSALARARSAGNLIVGEPVYAELAAHFVDQAAQQYFLDGLEIEVVASTPETLFLAGRLWREYQNRRPPGVTCSQCGASQVIRCAQCGRNLAPRQHIAADFMIGAHALLQADQLLTRDRGFYRTYFPQLVLIS